MLVNSYIWQALQAADVDTPGRVSVEARRQAVSQRGRRRFPPAFTIAYERMSATSRIKR